MKRQARQQVPTQHLLGELEELRRLLESISATYLQRLDHEIVEIIQSVQRLGAGGAATASHARDIRDMLALLENLQTKPDKGRRKDIKKIDEVIGDLQTYQEKW